MGGFLRSSVFIVTGLKHFTKEGFQRASKTFDNSVINKDMSGKTCMVTGANKGLGFTASKELAQRGCTLMMVCRNEARGREAVSKIIEATGNKDVHLQVCDVSSMADVKKMAAEYEASGKQLHVLVLNAGILPSERSASADGYESSFATNTLGPYVMARALEPVLKRSAPGSRVIFVSSGGMYTEPLVVDDLEAKKMRSYDGQAQYARDKRRQVAICERLAKLWGSSGVGTYAMHPGWSETEGVKSSIPGFWKAFGSKFRTPEQGVDTIIYLAQEDASKLHSGGFYLDRKPQEKHLPLSGTQYSDKQVDELWAKLAEMGGLPA